MPSMQHSSDSTPSCLSNQMQEFIKETNVWNCKCFFPLQLLIFALSQSVLLMIVIWLSLCNSISFSPTNCFKLYRTPVIFETQDFIIIDRLNWIITLLFSGDHFGEDFISSSRWSGNQVIAVIPATIIRIVSGADYYWRQFLALPRQLVGVVCGELSTIEHRRTTGCDKLKARAEFAENVSKFGARRHACRESRQYAQMQRASMADRPPPDGLVNTKMRSRSRVAPFKRLNNGEAKSFLQDFIE